MGLLDTPKFLRPFLGKTWLDEVGAVGGFAVGGPAGAGVGAGLGRAGYGISEGEGAGDIIKGSIGTGAKAYLAGTGAEALGLQGGSFANPGLSLGGSGGAASVGGGVAGGVNAGGMHLGRAAASSTPATLGTRLTSAGGGVLDFLKENPEAAFMAMSVLGQAQQGAAEEKRYQAEIERRNKIDAFRQKVLDEMQQQYQSSDPNNHFRNLYRNR